MWITIVKATNNQMHYSNDIFGIHVAAIIITVENSLFWSAYCFQQKGLTVFVPHTKIRM